MSRAIFQLPMIWSVCVFTAWLCAGHAFTAPPLADKLHPFFEKYCTECHDSATKRGGLDLESLSRDVNDAETLRRWVRVFDRIESGEMPPKTKGQPDSAALQVFLADLGESLVAADRGQRKVIYRRLNRAEYENTVRDLLRVRAEVAAILPEDSKAHGFDNIGEALAASTELVQAYLRAADLAINLVLVQEKEPERIQKHSTFTDGFKTRFNAKQLFRFLDEGVVAYHSTLKSTHVRNFAAPAAGTYRVTFHARAYNSKEPVKIEVGGGDVHNGNRGRHPVGYFDAMPEVTKVVFEDWFREGMASPSARSGSVRCVLDRIGSTPGQACC